MELKLKAYIDVELYNREHLKNFVEYICLCLNLTTQLSIDKSIAPNSFLCNKKENPSNRFIEFSVDSNSASIKVSFFQREERRWWSSYCNQHLPEAFDKLKEYISTFIDGGVIPKTV